jgi:hypothetical protein
VSAALWMIRDVRSAVFLRERVQDDTTLNGAWRRFRLEAVTSLLDEFNRVLPAGIDCSKLEALVAGVPCKYSPLIDGNLSG